MSIATIGLATPPASTLEASSGAKPVSALEAAINQMKQQLLAVQKDPKTDCKTKDWESHALTQEIQQLQQQITSQRSTRAEASQAQAAPVRPSTGATLIDCYA